MNHHHHPLKDDLAYYAAHAPEVPRNFQRKYTDELMGQMETDIQYTVRWRFEYAHAMIEARRERST